MSTGGSAGETLRFTIMGVPRSGTTALVRAVNLHPRVFCSNEFGCAPRVADSGFALPDAYVAPERFGIARRLLAEEREALEVKLAGQDPLVFGDKAPRYYLNFEQVAAAMPAGRHTAIYRSPHAFARSWDRRARNEKDGRWKRGQIGLFAFVEWLLFLDAVAASPRDLRVVAFDRMFFGSNGFFEGWFDWATGLTADEAMLATFGTEMLDALPPDAERAADSPYAELLDRVAARELGEVVSRADWQNAASLTAPLQAYLDAYARPLVDGVASGALAAGGAVLEHGRAQVTQCLRVRRHAPRASPALIAALERLAEALASPAASGAPRPAGGANIQRDLRQLLFTRVAPAEADAIVAKVMAVNRRRAIYVAFSLCFGSAASAESADAMARLLAAAGPAATERERLIASYLRERDPAAPAALRELASRLVDPGALTWALFLEAELRFHLGPVRRSRPERLIQYWNADPPPDVAAAFQEWRNFIGAGRHRLYDDESGRALLAEVAGAEGGRAFDACWHPAMRSDLVRLAALLQGGGLWLDADTRPLPIKTLPELGAGLHVGFTAQEQNPRFSNDMMAAPADHPLLAEALGHAIRNVLVRRIELPSAATGPVALTEILRLRGLGEDSTALSLSRARALIGKGWLPAYKASRSDPRSWQAALRQRRDA